ncbi:MAG: hypothetical protein KAW12_30335 [Candidatus Aminicenantes bacterium]|nr:hypothetical protein [Candidatus Aminicenantes bacterium]
MKLLRKKITTALIVLLIIGLGAVISGGVEPEEKEASLNPFFVIYQKFFNKGDIESYRIPGNSYYLGEIPSPVDRSHVKDVVNPHTRDWYPTSYDLRTLNKLTAIRNQGACGSCWTFATMASLESFGKPTNDWNFSEQDLNANHGFDYGECTGGNHDMAAAYLARWSGPLSETDVPYPYASEMTRGAFSPQKHIQQIIFVPQRSDFGDNDTIKYFISTYGAVYVSFYYSSSYIDTADLSFYNNVNISTNHAVAAVGWDDDYSAANFRPDRQPPGDGAFLIRNSWGTGRHDNGYLWLSYYDTSFKPRASLCNAEDPKNYDRIYQYDPLGQVSNSGYGGTTAWAANIFTAGENNFLKAVGFYTTDANTAYEIYIYKGVTPGNPSSGSLVATKTGSRVYPGYYTAVLSSPVSLHVEDVFSVVIKFTNSSYTYPIAIEKVYAGYSSGAVSNAGESFMSSSGSSWTDVYNYGWNVCIKAFTVNSYTISGTVSAAVAAIENVLLSGLPGNPLTNASGFYTANVENGWSGTVTPTLAGYIFEAPSTTYTDVNSDQTTDYTASGVSITVTSPNGGEKLDVGSVYDITWTSYGNVGNVKIQYSTNGGNYWRMITSSTENDGLYDWTVPGTPSGNCLIRILEKDNDGGPSDVSDAVFSIVSPVLDSLTLRSPNGGETWFSDRTLPEITWYSSGGFDNVTLFYSTDKGATWKTIAQSTPNDGSYSWNLTGPYTPSDECLVRITANDGSGDSGPSDVSDAVFSIGFPPSPGFWLTAPKGGEQLPVGSRFNITWESRGIREDVKIMYSADGQDTFTVITAATENDGEYEWIVPDTPSDQCTVIISKTGGGEPDDSSDQPFSIVQPSESVLRVLSPNGGESWDAGSLQEIAWSCAGDINNVTIDYSKDKGATWKQVVLTTPNDGSFEWTVPETPSDLCLVRVTSNDGDPDPVPSDVSDDVFSIVIPGPVIRVISPNGGEQLVTGSRTTITWYANNTREDVKIEYSTTGGDTWTAIAGATANNGKYDWTVPDVTSEICLVRISQTSGQPVDLSDKVFSIVPPLSQDITVISPNGRESWTAGSQQVIKWSSNGEINNVTIEYSTDNGYTWKMIVQTTPDDGTFDWTVPDTVSDKCLVRVSANNGDPDPVPSDVSDQVFSIVLSVPGEFKVTSPNGGESWEVGSSQSITWNSSGTINSVMLEYSYDNGNSRSTIESSVSNSGTYDWNVPDAVSDECLVRVTANDGSGDPKPADVSDEVFSIVLPSAPTIRLIMPNGGEELTVSTIYKISWYGSNTREPVKIEYSTNAGDAWTEIVGATENDGEYDWIVPDEPSQICLVRIGESGGQAVDVSDAVFSIVSASIGDMTVLAPNGGENLTAGSGYDITWTCSGINTIAIEYSVNNGSTWLYIDETSADNGSYAWTVPGTPSNQCLIRIRGAGPDENPADVSDGLFTISGQSQASIEVFTPNGGDSLSVGVEYYITWASSGVNDVLIEYSTDYGDQWTPIDTVPAIGGRCTWTVPGTPSDGCMIRISDTGSAVEDLSDDFFSIIPD